MRELGAGKPGGRGKNWAGKARDCVACLLYCVMDGRTLSHPSPHLIYPHTPSSLSSSSSSFGSPLSPFFYSDLLPSPLPPSRFNTSYVFLPLFTPTYPTYSLSYLPLLLLLQTSLLPMYFLLYFPTLFCLFLCVLLFSLVSYDFDRTSI